MGVAFGTAGLKVYDRMRGRKVLTQIIEVYLMNTQWLHKTLMKAAHTLGQSMLLVLILFGLPPWSHLAFALDVGHPKYRLQDRSNDQGEVDRKEGMQPLEIAGERLDLVSAFLLAPGLAGGSPGKQFRLGFFLPQAESRVKLQVRDYNAFKQYYYWMLPARTAYDSGFQQFAWNKALAEAVGLGLEQLGAVAWVRGHGYPVVMPLLLQASDFPAQIRVRGCKFVFVPNVTMEVAYRLFPKVQESLVLLERASETWNKGLKGEIVWDGQTPQRVAAPKGWYVLEIKTRIQYPGRPAVRIPFDYEFYYQPMIVR